MNQQPRHVRTEAEDGLLAAFDATRVDLPGNETADTDRQTALQQFADAGLPHRRVEAWKYTDLRRLMRVAAPPAPAAVSVSEGADPLAGVDRVRIVLVNGRYRADMSDLAGLDGVTVEDLATVLSENPARAASLVASGDPIVALNAAFVQGGVVVTVDRNVEVASLVEIAYLTEAAEPVAITPRIVVVLGENAGARLVETWRGPDGVAYQVNTLATADLAQGARLEWTRLQVEGDGAQHLASFFARLGRDANLNHLAVNAGAALWRWQGNTDVVGEGAHTAFSGATMLSGRNHGDTKLNVNHIVGYSTSAETFKTVVDGDATGAFQGLIVVKPDAQKTDARMMTQALLLSDEAQFFAKPELEIFADDVQCGHGATTGQIDETQLFYLMARGIPREEAARLLIEAFLDDAIDAIQDGALAAALRTTVSNWLARRSAGRAA